MMVRPALSVGMLFLIGVLGWIGAVGLPRQTEDEAVTAELRRSATPDRVAGDIAAALDRDAIDDASAYAELARSLGWPLPAPLGERLAAAVAAEDRVATHVARCTAGALTADMKTTTAIVCMVAADFTTLGDLRDIAIQGGALAADKEYDPVILGLSVLGLGATGLTALSAGGGGPAKAGLSVMKAAKRASLLSPALLRNARNLAADAVAPVRRTLAGADYRRPAALAEALGGELKQATRSDGAAKLLRAAGEIDDVRRAFGVAEAAKMLRHAEQVEDIGGIAKLYAKFGRKARPIMALTGKTGLHGFKAGYKLTREMLAPLGLLLGAAIALTLAFGARRAILRRMFAGVGSRQRPLPAPRLEPVLGAPQGLALAHAERTEPRLW